MKNSYVSALFLGLASLSATQNNFVKAGPNGVAYIDGPPAPAPVETITAKAKGPPAKGEEDLYVSPDNRPILPPLPPPTKTSAVQGPGPPSPRPIVPAASSHMVPGPAPPSPGPPAPALPAPAPPSPGGAQSGNGKVCINFSGNDFHFENAGSWAGKKGSGAQEASQCFDKTAGGSMFICESECNPPGVAATPKYTKL